MNNKALSGASNAIDASVADAAKDVKDVSGAGDAIDGITLAVSSGMLLRLPLNEFSQRRDENQLSADDGNGADQPRFNPALNGALRTPDQFGGVGRVGELFFTFLGG
jgi:hypothetical protein